jgi:hypothetical protein
MTSYAALVRHLTRDFALGALRRGKPIEQFLGPVEVDGVAGIRWVAVTPWSDGRLRVSLHTVGDPDDDSIGDLANLLSLDPVDEDYVGEGRELGSVDEPPDAIELAQRETGAAPDRWVNAGVVGEEYGDFVRARRRGA